MSWHGVSIEDRHYSLVSGSGHKGLISKSRGKDMQNRVLDIRIDCAWTTFDCTHQVRRYSRHSGMWPHICISSDPCGDADN